MKKIILPLTCWLSLTGGILSCTQRDKTAPSLSVEQMVPMPLSDSVCGEWEPNNVISVFSGDSLRMRLLFSDNEGLSQYKITIHENFDCHGHRFLSTAWNFSEIVNLDGPNATIDRALPVPLDVAAGNYHFEIMALDASGNELENFPIYTLKIGNRADELPPSFTLTAPTLPVTVSRGGTLTFEGTASDNFALDFGRAELRYRSNNGDTYSVGTYPFLEGTGTSSPFSISYTIPNGWAPGTYPFTLWLYDGYNNSYNQRVNVSVN